MPNEISCGAAAVGPDPRGRRALLRRAGALASLAAPAALLPGCAVFSPAPGPAGVAAPPLPPMRVAGAPKPPTGAQGLEEAVLSMSRALFDRARLDPPEGSGRYPLVVDPLIDRATGDQSAATRAMERQIAALVRRDYPEFEPQPFTLASLDREPLILLGAITPVAGAGVVPASTAPSPQVYRIWAVLGDLRTGTVVSHETAWVRAEAVDARPTAFFRDSPAWTEDGTTAAYLLTCAADPGEPIAPAYLDALRVQALVAEGISRYEDGRPGQALDAYAAAAALPQGRRHLRVRNGLYLSNRALGRRPQAEAAFGELVDTGLERGRLAVKFLFRPGGVAFTPEPAISGDYPMWLRQIARRADARGDCLDTVGHSSPTGPEPRNLALSRERAERVRTALLRERPALRPRTGARGVGSSRPLVGSGADDATDVLDRRVEFVAGCGASAEAPTGAAAAG